MKMNPKAEAVKETPAPAAAPTETQTQAKPSTAHPTPSGDRIKASPLAKRLAKEAGIELSDVTGSGDRFRSKWPYRQS